MGVNRLYYIRGDDEPQDPQVLQMIAAINLQDGSTVESSVHTFDFDCQTFRIRRPDGTMTFVHVTQADVATLAEGMR